METKAKNVVTIDPKRCILCANCYNFCNNDGGGAIRLHSGDDIGLHAYVVYDLCGGCQKCIDICPQNAIQKAIYENGIVKKL